MSKYADSIINDMISIRKSASHKSLFKQAEGLFDEEVEGVEEGVESHSDEGLDISKETEEVDGSDEDSILDILDKPLSDESGEESEKLYNDSGEDSEKQSDEVDLTDVYASMIIGLTKISAALDNYSLEAEAAKTLEVAKKVKKVMDDKKKDLKSKKDSKSKSKSDSKQDSKSKSDSKKKPDFLSRFKK